MKLRFIFLALCMSLLFLSCRKSSDKKEAVDYSNTEELLAPKTRTDLLTSGRGINKDLVQYLFDEAKKSDDALRSLVFQIDNMSKVQRDSLAEALEFIRYNEMYYSTALSYTDKLSDSIKRKQVKQLLSDSQEDFVGLVAKHQDGLITTGKLESRLNDQLILMKILISMSLVESFQGTLPDIERINGLNDQYEKLIDQTEKYVE